METQSVKKFCQGCGWNIESLVVGNRDTIRILSEDGKQLIAIVRPPTQEEQESFAKDLEELERKKREGDDDLSFRVDTNTEPSTEA